jgi:hypothetical protein
MGVPPKPPAQTPSHEVIESGAVQQSRASALRTSSERPALVTERVSTTARPVATAVSPKAGAPARSEPSTVLPQPRLPNLSISVSGASDLKILPPEMLVDARTRLTNGEDLVEQGDYLVARRIFRAALVQLDSIGARYPESQSVRSLRREIEQADVRAGQACGAENEMRKRRGESLRGCQ